MIEFYKKRGETPLEALERLCVENPELTSEILSYAGRLDPMAEGILPVLIGEKENKNRQQYLSKDKEYYAEFVLGISTDTGDILGIVQKTNFKKIDESLLRKTFEEFVDIKSQTYPWYSSKTVNGKPLFEYAREGNFDIKRPTRDVVIYNTTDIQIKEESLEKLVEQYVEDVQGVKGDFRQEKIVREWRNVNCHPELVSGSLTKNYEAPKQVRGDILQIVSCALSVSSGTYVRALCEHLEDKLGIPVVLQQLVRTQVF